MAQTFKALGLLLSYPTEELQQAVPDILALFAEEGLIPTAERQAIAAFLGKFVPTDIYELQERYFSLFDRSRTLSLHLFEHIHGESRDRGQAMADLKSLYQRHGLEMAEDELPDFLPLFLEFLSQLPLGEARGLLSEPARILRALADRLAARGTPYAAVMAALATLAQAPAVRALVIRELLLQRAAELRLAAEPQEEDGRRETEEEALIRVLLEAEVTIPTADEAACRRYYTANPQRFRSPDLFEPLHILFQAVPEDVAGYALARQKAEAALDRVKRKPDLFEILARDLSDCPSASEGGRLGQVTRGQTTPEFETALVAMQPGELYPTPVETRYGFHLLYLDRRVEGRVLPFEQVQRRIADYLTESAWRRAVSQYVSVLAGVAEIRGCDLPGATSPLVQ